MSTFLKNISCFLFGKHRMAWPLRERALYINFARTCAKDRNNFSNFIHSHCLAFDNVAFFPCPNSSSISELFDSVNQNFQFNNNKKHNYRISESDKKYKSVWSCIHEDYPRAVIIKNGNKIEITSKINNQK